MTRNARLAMVAAVAAAAAAATAVSVEHARAAPARTDAQLIADAASAAPVAIGRAAAVVAPNGSGGMRTLRRGSNGWTCMPDEPNTPADDPMCVDANGMLWASAWMGHHIPPLDKPGLAYMLRGAADASNIDAYAAKPAAGAGWVRTGPHIMILDRNAAARSGYPGGPRPDTSRPYVMFAGTPYAHIMMPVR